MKIAILSRKSSLYSTSRLKDASLKRGQCQELSPAEVQSLLAILEGPGGS